MCFFCSRIQFRKSHCILQHWLWLWSWLLLLHYCYYVHMPPEQFPITNWGSVPWGSVGIAGGFEHPCHLQEQSEQRMRLSPLPAVFYHVYFIQGKAVLTFQISLLLWKHVLFWPWVGTVAGVALTYTEVTQRTSQSGYDLLSPLIAVQYLYSTQKRKQMEDWFHEDYS